MKCPGQDTQYWNQDAIFDTKCPECGSSMEFFKDDTSRKCRNCGKRIVNPSMDFGCASYCQYADQCIATLPEEFVKQREDLLKDRVAVEMKRYFQSDFRRIGHAMRVARYAEQIGKEELAKKFDEQNGNSDNKLDRQKEDQAEKDDLQISDLQRDEQVKKNDMPKENNVNLAVILCAAYLHDIGIKESERKYNSNAPKYQELEGPPIAREILEKLGAKAELVEEVCDIVGHHHHPRENETINFKVLYDSDLITNLEEEQKEKQEKNEEPITRERLERIIAKSFLTQSGEQKARAVLL
ncbi:MAG: HD domain-containing protein [Desulfamplus sp.]|nr:HD domain-containing protein [Desulfamplus sp.]